MLWEEFLKEAREFVHLSDRFEDGWKFVVKDDNVGQSYLRVERKVAANFQTSEEEFGEESDLIDHTLDQIEAPSSKSFAPEEELINIEYHVVYSMSYQVPILYFKGFKSDGTAINLEDSWRIFTNQTFTRKEMLSILTQMDHPILFRPFLSLHPCKTAELLEQTKGSKNRIITFLSIMGPFVKLHLKEEYGMVFRD